MWNLIWPILLVILANTIYNIAAKSTPEGVNAFASLTVTYLIGAVLCAIIFFFTSQQKNIIAEVGKSNWTSVVLAVAIVGLEFGYISIYRAGWKVSAASLYANIGLACVLLFVGFLLYKEVISLRQIVGVIVCGLGLILIRK